MMNTEQLYQLFLQNPSVQTDTRKLKKGDLFFALKGPNFDANEFAMKSIEAGAAFAVIDDARYANNDRIILVEDSLQALQQLALHHRRQLNIPVIAITGSNGKTTTKELIHAVLLKKYRTYTTQGNLNNHIGVPLTLLSIGTDADMAVIEMGANHQKEIESYCSYTEPTHGIITNCGKAHLEGFGGEEGVRKGKGELFDYLRAHHGSAFIMSDYEYLVQMSKGIQEVITYGSKEAETLGSVLRSEPFLEIALQSETGTEIVRSKLVGAYNLPNLLVAVSVGRHFKVPETQIREALENYEPSNSRSQMIQKDGNNIILDAYNANPSSMKAAIENLASLRADNKVLILGAMAELGEQSLLEHEKIVQLIHEYDWKDVVLVGGDFMHIPHPFTRLANSTEAAKWYQHQKLEKAYILIKGSRSMRMEETLH